jgi:ribosome recycling factor
MDKAIEGLHKEFNKVRTGRASVSLLDGISVDYYGTSTPLNQVATLSAPESRLITIQPWDSSIIGEVKNAIQRSELALTPINDGKVIRISIPSLTEERRKDLVKVVRKKAEECKVSLRNCRRGANEELKELKKKKEISEDDLYRDQEEVQKLTDKYTRTCDRILETKEKEVLEF